MPCSSVDAAPDNETAMAARVDGEMPWLDGSQLCAQVDPELFFPSFDNPFGSTAGAFAAARRVCARCPLQVACAVHAVEHVEYGVWGGTSEGWRRRLRGRTRDRGERIAAVEARTGRRRTPAAWAAA